MRTPLVASGESLLDVGGDEEDGVQVAREIIHGNNGEQVGGVPRLQKGKDERSGMLAGAAGHEPERERWRDHTPSDGPFH
jgi:hypothetical protein